jgi:hypothetical protein
MKKTKFSYRKFFQYLYGYDSPGIPKKSAIKKINQFLGDFFVEPEDSFFFGLVPRLP